MSIARTFPQKLRKSGRDRRYRATQRKLGRYVAGMLMNLLERA